MKFIHKRFKKITLVSSAGYFLMFALCAKVVSLIEERHPSKDELTIVNGTVEQVRLGGNGKATWFKIESKSGTLRYSSYYGIVWPGMKRIRSGDLVNVLAEKDRLNKNELITGKKYYIWELVHRNQTIVSYEDTLNLVQGKESTINQYINGFIIAGAVFLFIAYMRKLHLLKDG
jgi:hypothetical protein